MNDPGVGGPRRHEDVQRALDIGVDERLGRSERLRHGYDGSEVEHDLVSLDRLAHEPSVPNVAAYRRNALDFVQPAQAVVASVERQPGDFVPGVPQGLAEMRPDKAIGPGNKSLDD